MTEQWTNLTHLMEVFNVLADDAKEEEWDVVDAPFFDRRMFSAAEAEAAEKALERDSADVLPLAVHVLTHCEDSENRLQAALVRLCEANRPTVPEFVRLSSRGLPATAQAGEAVRAWLKSTGCRLWNLDCAVARYVWQCGRAGRNGRGASSLAGPRQGRTTEEVE